MNSISKCGLIPILFLFVIIEAINGQIELFPPGKSIEIVDFVVSDNERLLCIDASNKLYYSSGSGFINIQTKANLKQIWVESDSIFAASSTKLYYINDKPYVPTITEIREISWGGSFHKVLKKKIGITQDSFLLSSNDTLNNQSSKPNKISDAALKDNILYITSPSGIYTYTNSSRKSYQIPGVRRYGKFNTIAVSDNQVIVTTNAVLYSFNKETYQLEKYEFNEVIDQVQIQDQSIWLLSKANIFCIKGVSKNWPTTIGQLYFDNKLISISNSTQSFSSEGELKIIWDHRSLHQNGMATESYMLDGVDESWKNINTDRNVYQLNNGSYSLNIKQESGQKTEIVNLFEFKVEEGKDDTILYIMGSISLLLLLYALYQKNKHQSQVKNLNDKITLLKTQSKLLKEKSKVLQLQINPHFLFNALNNIQGLLVKKEIALAKNQLRNFSLLMRTMLDSVDVEWISIEDDINFLKRYLALENINHSTPFHYTFEIDSNLNYEWKIPPMLTQILVENAIIHGINNSDSSGILHIKYKVQSSDIEFEIIDNGPGVSMQSKKHHVSKGSTIINQRLELMGYQQSYTINNIVEDGIVAGCKASLIIPLKRD